MTRALVTCLFMTCLCLILLTACNHNRSNKDSVTFETEGGEITANLNQSGGPGDPLKEEDKDESKKEDVVPAGTPAALVLDTVTLNKLSDEGVITLTEKKTFLYDEKGYPTGTKLDKILDLKNEIEDNELGQAILEYKFEVSKALYKILDGVNKVLDVQSITYDDKGRIIEMLVGKDCGGLNPPFDCAQKKQTLCKGFDDLDHCQTEETYLNGDKYAISQYSFEGDKLMKIESTGYGEIEGESQIKSFIYDGAVCLKGVKTIVSKKMPDGSVKEEVTTDEFACGLDEKGSLKTHTVGESERYYYYYNEAGQITSIKVDHTGDGKIDYENIYTYKEAPKMFYGHKYWKDQDPNFQLKKLGAVRIGKQLKPN